MIVFIPAVIVCALGYWYVYRQWRLGLGCRLFVLTTLPMALLFLVAPLPIIAIRAIGEFRAIAASGVGGAPAAAALVLLVVRPLQFGGLAFALALCVAAILQVKAMRPAPEPDEPPPPMVERRTTTWATWVLIASSFLLLPATLLAQVIFGVARLMTQASVPATLATMDPAQVSTEIAARLTVGGFLGLPVGLLTLLMGIANLIVTRLAAETAFARRASWAVLALAMLADLWLMVASLLL
jgi:hypothetical protein